MSAVRNLGWRRFGRRTADVLPLRLDRRRIYILPTRQGLSFTLVLGLMLLGAINYDNSLAYALTFLLGAVGVVSLFHTWGNLLNLRIGLGALPQVFAEQAVSLPVAIDNRGGKPRLGVELQFEGGPIVRCDLEADAWHTVSVPHPPLRRGRRRLRRLRVATRFPLGLVRAWTPLQPEAELLVYPRPAPGAGTPPATAYVPSQQGDRGVGSDDFAGFRAYQPGDSLRHVNWKAASRGLGLDTKVFGGDRVEQLLIDWRSLPGLDREARLSRMARAVLDAEALGRAYGLWLPNASLAPQRGARHEARCLDALAVFEAEA